MADQKITIVEWNDGSASAFLNMNPDLLAHWGDSRYESDEEIKTAYCLRVDEMAKVLQHVLRGMFVLRSSIEGERFTNTFYEDVLRDS